MVSSLIRSRDALMGPRSWWTVDRSSGAALVIWRSVRGDRTGSGGDQLEQSLAPSHLARISRCQRRLCPGRSGQRPSGHAIADYAMALTAVDNLDLNASGMGIYPLSSKPFWPAPMVLCRKAFTAIPTWGSEYFEQTIS